jgi:hypothetical protein
MSRLSRLAMAQIWKTQDETEKKKNSETTQQQKGVKNRHQWPDTPDRENKTLQHQ